MSAPFGRPLSSLNCGTAALGCVFDAPATLARARVPQLNIIVSCNGDKIYTVNLLTCVAAVCYFSIQP
jgi:hypothetical protein